MRKRKFHLTDYDDSITTLCGQYCVRAYHLPGRPIANGLYGAYVKSPCKITCKVCRKTWMFHQLVRRVKATRAT